MTNSKTTQLPRILLLISTVACFIPSGIHAVTKDYRAAYPVTTAYPSKGRSSVESILKPVKFTQLIEYPTANVTISPAASLKPTIIQEARQNLTNYEKESQRIEGSLPLPAKNSRQLKLKNATMAGSLSDHMTSHVLAKNKLVNSKNATTSRETSKTTLTSNAAHKRTNATRISRLTTLRETTLTSNAAHKRTNSTQISRSTTLRETTLTLNASHKQTNSTRISRSTTLRDCPVQSNRSTAYGNWGQKSCSGACGLYKLTDYLDICQCDDLCFVNGDCCPDVEQVCPQLTPHPEARKTRCWGYYPIFDGEFYP